MGQRQKLSPDEVFELLANHRRRYVLHYLRLAESNVTEFEPLIEWVVDHLDDQNAPREEQYEQLETSLHHVHLPQLAASGVVDYDWRSRTIRYRTSQQLEAHLELAETEDLS